MSFDKRNSLTILRKGSLIDDVITKQQCHVPQHHAGSNSYANNKNNMYVKLDCSQLCLHGREKERTQILAELEKVCNDGPLRVFLVHGGRGSGKTRLIDDALEKMERPCIFISTKFDRISTPFSALVNVFYALGKEISQRRDCTAISDRIKQRLSAQELSLLYSFAPRLKSVLGETNDSQSNSGYTNYTAHPGLMDRLLIVMRDFVGAIATKDSPVIMFMDDMQWSDQHSMQVFLWLTKSPQARNILVIGAYRDGELSQVHREYFQQIKEAENACGVRLGDLTFDGINALIAEVISLPLEAAEPLTALLYRKTGGNCSHVIQILGLLQDKGHLYYSRETCSWQWEVDKIVEAGVTLHGIKDVVVARIQKLPAIVQSVLQIAACLGYSFDPDFVAAVKESEDREANAAHTSLKVPQVLQMLKKLGLIEDAARQRCQFVHDSIQQVCYELFLKKNLRQKLHLKIGFFFMQLYNTNGPSWDDQYFFLSVDHLNLGAGFIKKPSEAVRVAELNLQAAEKAKERSAILLAFEYGRRGMQILRDTFPDPELWKGNYDLLLTLATFVAELQLFDLPEKFKTCTYATKAILQEGRTLADKMRCHVVVTRTLGGNGQLEEAVTYGCRVLKEAGYRLPRRLMAWNVVTEIVRARRLAQSVSDEDFLNLSGGTDLFKMDCIKLMNYVAFFSQFSPRDRLLLPILKCKVLRETLAHGMSPSGVNGLAGFGAVLVAVGYKEDGLRMGSIATRLLGRVPNCGHVVPSVNLYVHGAIMHWAEPTRRSLEPLLEGYKIAIRVGDMDASLSNAGLYATMSYSCGGRNLDTLCQDIRAFKKQAHDYGQESNIAVFAVLESHLLYLMDGWVEGNEDVLSDSSFVHEAENIRVTKALVDLERAFFFENDQLLRDSIRDVEGFHEYVKTHFLFSRLVFLLGLSWSRLAATTGKRKYKRLAQKHMMQIEKGKGRNADSDHMYDLLSAEKLAMSTSAQNGMAEDLFVTAIESACTGGFLQDEAIANELAGGYYLRMKEIDSARTHLQRAARLYHQWGARSKMQQLRSRHKILLLSSQIVENSVSEVSTGASTTQPSSMHEVATPT